MSNKMLIAVMLGGMIGIIVLAFVRFSGDSGTPIPHFGTSKAEACDKTHGECMPDVKYIDTAGVAYTPESLKGKVVLVNFWATWCHPCLGEIPDLSKAYDKYKNRGVVFLAVMSDRPQPSDTDLLNFQSDHEMTYPVVRVTPDIFNAFDYPPNLPTTFVFNRAGKRVLTKVGAMSESMLDNMLDQLVAEK